MVQRQSFLWGAYSRERYVTSRNITKRGNYFYGFDLSGYQSRNYSALDQYLCNPSLQFAINKVATYVSNASFQYIEGDEQKENPILDLLSNPNEFQSTQDFIREHVVYNLLYGFTAIYKEGIIKDVNRTNQLFNLNSKYIKTYERNLFERIARVNTEYLYEYTEDGKSKKLKPEDVISFYDLVNGIEGNYLKGVSRVESLKIPLENVLLSLEGEHVAMSNPGGRGIIHKKDGDGAGGIGFQQGENGKKSEKQEIEERMSAFGGYGNKLSQNQFIVTEHNLGYIPFRSPLKDYPYNDNFWSNHKKVCIAFGIPKELIGFDESKYENKEKAEVQFYTGTCQNVINNFCQSLTNHFELEGELVANFDNVPVIKHYQFKANIEQAKHIQESAKAINALLMDGVNEQIAEDIFKKLTGYEIEINQERIQQIAKGNTVQNAS